MDKIMKSICVSKGCIRETRLVMPATKRDRVYKSWTRRVSGFHKEKTERETARSGGLELIEKLKQGATPVIAAHTTRTLVRYRLPQDLRKRN